MLALGCLAILLSACSTSSTTPVPAAGTISGRLVDSSGNAVTATNLILLTTSDTAGRYGPTNYRSRTDGSGHFSFQGVDAGKYVIVDDPGDPLKLDMRTMAGGPQVGCEFDLPASHGLDLGTLTTSACG